MNFNVDEKKLAMDGAFQALGKAAQETEKAHDSLQTIPSKGIRGWLHAGDLKIALAKYETVQETQAECQAIFNDAVKAYEEAVLHQGIADAAATEASVNTHSEDMDAIRRILPAGEIETRGMSAVKSIEKLNQSAEKIRIKRASHNADLRAAETLGFTGKPAS